MCKNQLSVRGTQRSLSQGHWMAWEQWVTNFAVWVVFWFGSVWYESCSGNNESSFPPCLQIKLCKSSRNKTVLKQVEHSGELGRLSWIEGLGFPVHHLWPLVQLPGDRIHLPCHVCSHLKDDFMVVGKEMSPSLLTRKCQSIQWLPKGLLLQLGDSFHSQKPKSVIFLQYEQEHAFFLKLPETDWDAAVAVLVKKWCAGYIPHRAVTRLAGLPSAWRCFSVTLWGSQDMLYKIRHFSLCCWVLLNSVFISADVFPCNCHPWWI